MRAITREINAIHTNGRADVLMETQQTWEREYARKHNVPIGVLPGLMLFIVKRDLCKKASVWDE
eukprot:4839324-Amphidinium_carterae.1